MKKQDWILILCVIIVLAPFFIPATGFFDWFTRNTAAHPFIMAFFKLPSLPPWARCWHCESAKASITRKASASSPA